MSYPIDLKAIPEQAVASIREQGPLSSLLSSAARLRASLAAAGVQAIGPLMMRLYDGDPGGGEPGGGGDVDFEVSLPIATRPDGSVPDRIGEARGDIVPAHHVFATVHQGPCTQTHRGHAAIAHQLSVLGYAKAGPATEVYLRPPVSSRDEEDCLTELRQPIAR